MEKRELRRIIRERKATVCAEEHRRWSDAICQRLLQHPRVAGAETIMLFHPLPDEPDIREVISVLTARGRKVLLPVVTGPETMELREYQSEEYLVPGALGTQHPDGRPFTDFEAIDTAIIPGVAFDRSGNRMGRGKGYYDRFLTRLAELVNTINETTRQRNNQTAKYTIGVCFAFQIVDEVPTGPMDVAMDEVLTQ